MNRAADHRDGSLHGPTTSAITRTNRLAATVSTMLLLALVSSAYLAASAVAAEPPYLGAFGPDGSESTAFDRPDAVAVDEGTGAVYVADTGDGRLYKFDAEGNPSNWTGSAGYLSGNQLSGISFATANPGENQVAVDQETHVIYVTSGNTIRAFEANGDPHLFEGGTSELSGMTPFRGVAVDKNGAIYVSESESSQGIRIYSRAGVPLTEFVPKLVGGGAAFSTSLAVASDGSIYLGFLTPGLRVTPDRFPVTSATTYSQATVIGSEEALKISPAVDPSTGYIYLTELYRAAGPSSEALARVGVYDTEEGLIGSLGVAGQPGELDHSATGIAVNGIRKRVYVVSPDDIPAQVQVFGSFQIPVLAPEIAGTSATDVETSAATLHARVNPHASDTTYRFEYGTMDCSGPPGACQAIPLGGESVGSGHRFVPVSAALTGLPTDTQFYYRLVAENEKDTVRGPVRTFRTQATDVGFKPMDGRVWEQVTPLDKQAGSVTNGGVVVRAAEDGNGIAFGTKGSIVPEPEGNRAPEFSSVLARRGAEGWQVESLVPPHQEATATGFGPEYKGFSSGLDRALLEPRDETPLSPEASERAPYLRVNSSPPAWRPLVTAKEGFANVPPGTVFSSPPTGAANDVLITGANADLSAVTMQSIVPLVPGAAEQSLYLWREGDLQPVSELPAEEGGEGEVVQGELGSADTSVRHAISSDGGRVFWSSFGSASVSKLNYEALYIRDVAAGKSVRLDVEQPGATGSGRPNPIFTAADADGTAVFFTDTQQLTVDANPGGRDLYRCQIGTVNGALGCVAVKDVSVSAPGSGERADVEPLALGASEDGSRIYFVARGILDETPNAAGETAHPGAPNLYVWSGTEGTRFVATLSPEDHLSWGVANGPPRLSLLASRTSENGRYLTFMSERSLEDRETSDPATGSPVEQIYRYDAIADRLLCVSCSPDGATTAGFLQKESGNLIKPDLPLVWSNRLIGGTEPMGLELAPSEGYVLYEPRGVLDNGRTFFNSPVSLVSADTNGGWDVYQYEPFGVGDCSPSSRTASIAVVEAGCLGLISSGAGDSWSVMLDASASGDDVFFITADQLSALDKDQTIDVYDARVGGSAAVVPAHPECLGEACQPPPAPPVDATPASASFFGPGNKNRQRCRRGRHNPHRKGKKLRCVKSHPHRKNHGKGGRVS